MDQLNLTQASEPNPEELYHYHRDIVERVAGPDGSDEVTLACGHKIVRIVGGDLKREYCPECVQLDIDQARRERDGFKAEYPD